MVQDMVQKYQTDNWAISSQELGNICVQLQRARAEKLKARKMYDNLKDRRGPMIEKFKLAIRDELKNEGFKKPTLLEIEGSLPDHEDYETFQVGYEAARDAYEEAKVKVDDLETLWESARSIISDRRYERGSTLKEAAFI